MSIIDQLTVVFEDFPGIGPRQARRFVMYLLSRDGETMTSFIDLLSRLKRETRRCAECHRVFESERETVCLICSDSSRDPVFLMVVLKDIDIATVEKSDAYRGYYVLNGPWLAERIKRAPELAEIVLAFAATPEGDRLSAEVRESLASLVATRGIKISTLGRGFSTGTELEYSDAATLTQALKHRG